MTIEACDDLALVIPDGASQEFSVEVSRRLRIELVDAIRQECLKLSALRFISQWGDLGLHGA